MEVSRDDIDVLREEGGIRIRIDRPGERAVSALLSEDDAALVLAQLAGLTGFTITPTGSSGDVE